MKRVHKLIISAVVLVIGGLIAIIIGMSVLGWNFKKLDVTEYTAKVFQTSEQVSSIKLDVDSFPVQIVGGDEIRLDYYDATNSKVSVSVSDGVLEIAEKRRHNPIKYGLFNFGREDHPYVLTVSDDTELSFVGSNCEIKFLDVEFDSVKMDISNLDAQFRNCTIGKLDIRSDNLSLDMEHCTVTNAVIDAENSDIELSNCNGESVEIKTTNTNVDFYRGDFSSVSVVSVNSDMSFERTVVKTLDLRAANADISLERLTVDNLTVSARTLDAELEIAGKRSDYTIICSGRDMPSNNVGKTDKTIRLSGTYNDVELDFV